MGARSKGDTEDAEEDVNLITLPEAEAGRIFFADMNSSWNHVGMYTSADTIIESMPEHGVYEASIYDDKTRQQCVDSGHDDSGIYKVKDATEEDVAEAIEWARGYIECEYDYDFVNNKKNTTDENKKFNCSELVWKAYRYGASSEIDLDSNGGKAVYPNNIINSSETEYEKALR